MKSANLKVVDVLAISLMLALLFFLVVTTTSGVGEYNPYLDSNNDGEIDIFDAIALANAFGSSGTPLVAQAGLEYDSDWIDITDKCGQSFNITHNLNSTDIIVDITGKTRNDSGPHQIHLGLTSYTQGWSQTHGGASQDYAISLVQTLDGGYALAGSTDSFGAGWQFYLVKTDTTGNMQWNKTYGGANIEDAISLVQTLDGGYALAGHTTSFGSGTQAYLVKTNAAGNMQWNKTYGGAGVDSAYSLVQTLDGGYALAGHTDSFGSGIQAYLVKTDVNGTLQWNQTYGGASQDYAISLVQTLDGGYALAGYTDSFGSGVQAYLVKTNAIGTLQWNQTYGGANHDYARSLVQTLDGGYTLAGYTDSFGSGYQAYLAKTNAIGTLQWNQTYGGIGNDRAESLVQTLDGGYTLAGHTTSFGSGWQAYLVKADSELGLCRELTTENSIWLYRGATDPYWNYVRVRIWKIQ